MLNVGWDCYGIDSPEQEWLFNNTDKKYKSVLVSLKILVESVF